MADAELEKTTAKINISTNQALLTASGEVIKFDGFLKLYIESSDEEEDQEAGRLPSLAQGQRVELLSMTATERYSRPPARYTEASLVKKMEELGIGRPSTYAPTISTILKRGYAEKTDREGQQRSITIFTLNGNGIAKNRETENFGAEKSKLFPTDLGFVVTDFLGRHFEDVMDYGFTASIEEEFDQIADGKKVWNTVVKDFYEPFHRDVAETLEKADRATGERFLGEHPESRKPVLAKMGRFGPMIQLGSSDDEEKPQFASLRPGQSIETISLEDALQLFRLPFSLGHWQEKEVSVGIGRFGPYVKFGDDYISLPKGEDPLQVNMERARQLIGEKQTADAPIATFQGQPVTKGKGRFGPFIKWGDLYINVPRKYSFENLTQENCEELINSKLEKEANRYIQQWPELKISIENGRWGPYIRFGKKMLKLGKPGKSKFSAEEAAALPLEEVKSIITAQVPDAFAEKKKAGAKETGVAPKKKSAKAAPKKKAAK
jgi:DNA topoisomerase-1